MILRSAESINITIFYVIIGALTRTTYEELSYQVSVIRPAQYTKSTQTTYDLQITTDKFHETKSRTNSVSSIL